MNVARTPMRAPRHAGGDRGHGGVPRLRRCRLLRRCDRQPQRRPAHRGLTPRVAALTAVRPTRPPRLRPPPHRGLPAPVLGALDELADVPRDLAPQLAREMVAHPLEHDELGSRDRAGGGPAAADSDERIVGPVQDERRHRERPERRGPVARGSDRHELPADTDGIVGAVIGESSPPAADRPRRARIPASRSRARSRPFARSPPRASPPAATAALRLPPASPARRMDRRCST